ncbi:MAG TPA: RidA family protein [Patescibacteria group bacterium]|nr:RidA family protein [Patescibacteria group bacterium]
MKSINTDKAPKAFGPYSQAIIANGFIFCAGQVGFNRATDTFEEGVDAQTHQAMKNLQAVLEESGSDFEQVVKTTIFLKDLSDFETVNKIYSSYFKENKPARSTVQAARLPKDALVEIDMIAINKECTCEDC